MLKFDCSIIINQPLKHVTHLFSDLNNLKEYQDGFIKKELLSGTSGQVGAISMLYYKTGKREMELKETILKNDLPNEFFAEYHHKHMIIR